MPRFSANLSFLFTELPFRERFKAAADAGFKGVEFLFPYDEPAEQLDSLARDNRLEVALFNVWPGDWEAGERGLAGVPGREDEFARRLEQALGYAQVLGCSRLHVMAGLETQGANEATLIGNLQRACVVAAGYDVKLLCEPINRKDMPGYLVHRTAQARGIIEAVETGDVCLQFDCYHREVEEGDTVAAIAAFAGLTAHYQIASPVDRGEPDAGELDYRAVFSAIDATGYTGWVGCEYRPRAGTREGLKWRAALEVA
ncbi:MAG: hydroxypyruvate isomerase [Alphaproteobacteria bacterium BRH_c36]|nr:MAG: hydroxypyruvate isomerase [Alphaproteobacteria bacterium BRH_c36]